MKRLSALVTLLAAAGAAAQAASLPDNIVARVGEACVLIHVAVGEGQPGAAGSGFFVSRNVILTNHHVVKAAIDGEAKVSILINGGTKERKLTEATIVASDEELDLALLRTTENAPTSLRFLPDRQLKVTMPVWAVGFPFGPQAGLEVTFTTGTISALRHDDAGTLQQVQIDAAVNPGNSGGPVVDSLGRVVGVTRATINPTVGSGMALAIPSGAAENFVKVAEKTRRRTATLHLGGKSSRRGLRVVKAEKVEETWGTGILITVRGSRDADQAEPFIIEVADRRREVLKRDAVLIDQLQAREEKTYTLRLRGVGFDDVASCNIIE